MIIANKQYSVIHITDNVFEGYITRFLNLACWRILAKLTFSTYVVHLLVIYAFYSSQDRPLHFTLYNFVYWFVGKYIIT